MRAANNEIPTDCNIVRNQPPVGMTIQKSPANPSGKAQASLKGQFFKFIILLSMGVVACCEKASAQSSGGDSSPEYALGLRIEQGARTNGYVLLDRELDVERMLTRAVNTLPASDAIKKAIVDHESKEVPRMVIVKRALSEVNWRLARFLGVRRFESETELLFRSLDLQGNASYTGFIAQAQAGVGVKLIDVHLYLEGELMSQSLRRSHLLKLASAGNLDATMNKLDQALVSSMADWKLLESRYHYGKFDLVKQAFEKLPEELQNERAALSMYASSGCRSESEVLVPLDRWRKLYPDDPCPEIKLVEFYWSLYALVRPLTTKGGVVVNAEHCWTAAEETKAIEAIQRANTWLVDPAQDIHLAGYFKSRGHPEKAVPLLKEDLKLSPNNDELLGILIDLSLDQKNFEDAGSFLRAREVLFHTNLTQMVNAAPEYGAFRKSFAYKQWQYNFHRDSTNTPVSKQP